jgi:hypothetical protein
MTGYNLLTLSLIILVNSLFVRGFISNTPIDIQHFTNNNRIQNKKIVFHTLRRHSMQSKLRTSTMFVSLLDDTPSSPAPAPVPVPSSSSSSSFTTSTSMNNSTDLINDVPVIIPEAIVSLTEISVDIMKNILTIFFGDRHYARFYALETIARVPYFSYVSVLHLYETLGLRNKDLLTCHFNQSMNELMHLHIMEELGIYICSSYIYIYIYIY